MTIQLRPPTAAMALISGLTLVSSAAFGQLAPPDPSRTQEPQSLLPALPAPGAPNVVIPPSKTAFMGGDIKVTPSAFRFTGNTLITTAELQAVVAGLVGKEIDFNGLADAAAALRQHYAAAGYVLTDVYFPEQRFDAAGGVVEFAVIEARVGTVTVKVAEGSGVSQAFAEALATHYLRAGAPISQYLLDKPVLLLRDMSSTEAEAAVVPGANPGEADIEIDVSKRGARFEPYVSIDNMGPRPSGQYRIAAGININAPLGIGDVLSARVQGADKGGNTLFRGSYGLAVGPLATKLSISYTQSQYVLGEQFAALDASGKAEVAAFSAVQPLIRGRYTNVFAIASYEDKKLADDIVQQAIVSRKRVSMVRLGLLGNHSDRLLAGGTTSASATYSAGDLRLDDASATADIGTAPRFGPHTAGKFWKFNAELQRVQYLSERSSILAGLSGQVVSKNVTSAEKFNLGGPQGVRGYPIGEGIGDEGLLASIEYRYLTDFRFFGEALNLTAFYDYGRIHRDKVRNATTQTSTLPNSLTLDSYGFGILLGHEGAYVVTASVSTRLGGPLPTTGDPDSRTRLWLLVQKWF